MIKHKYSVEFNMDEVSGNPEPCGSCHFNTNSGEVIICLARNCDVQPNEDNQVVKMDKPLEFNKINTVYSPDKFMMSYLNDAVAGESVWVFIARKNIHISDTVKAWLYSQGA